MERIKLERVFRFVQVGSEIVTRVFRDSRDDPRAGAAGRADHQWSRLGHADTCHGEGR